MEISDYYNAKVTVNIICGDNNAMLFVFFISNTANGVDFCFHIFFIAETLVERCEKGSGENSGERHQTGR